MTALKSRAPMTDAERKIALALQSCEVHWASGHKRFIASMSLIADRQPAYGITSSQREQLHRLAYRYRRQIPDAQDLVDTNVLLKDAIRKACGA